MKTSSQSSHGRTLKSIRIHLSVALTFQEFSCHYPGYRLSMQFLKGHQIDGENIPTGDNRKPSKCASGHVCLFHDTSSIITGMPCFTNMFKVN